MCSENSETKLEFSFKRYFINNVDSYHGHYIVKEVSKVLGKNVPSRPSTPTILAEDAEPMPVLPPEQPYEIIGTAIDPKDSKGKECISKIVTKEECLPQMLTCGTVIFDISYDRDELRIATDYLKLLKELLEKHTSTAVCGAVTDAADDGGGESKKRNLILISTILTWASTKPLDPDNADMPFIESDFRKRKPHPNYKLHFDLENEVIGIARKYRSQIGALVVTSGVTYGGREDVFYYWFQKAWECEQFLPILGRGNNYIPLINVLDLAQIIYNLVTDFPKKLYILAVEQSMTKQREIIKPLGRQIGSGMFKCIPPEDAFLIPNIDQRIYDLTTVNLSMEPTFIVETMGLQWTSEGSFAENVPILMKQFKADRKLRAFKVVVYGPPLVGKTTLSKQICENYGLIYISPETVVQDVIDELSVRVNHWDKGEFAELPQPMGEEEAPVDDDEDDAEDEEAQDKAKKTLALLTSGRQPTEEELLGYLRQKLLSHEAENRGWVLDGFPTSLAFSAALFERGEEQDMEIEEESKENKYEEDVGLYENVLRKILPDIVVSLQATDDFICDKSMQQPEGNPRFEEETVLKRLTDFRAGDTNDNTPLNFFDELYIHPMIVPVSDHQDYDMKTPYKLVSIRMGQPCRYEKLMKLIEAAENKEKEELETLRTQEEKAVRELEERLKNEREDKMEYWSEVYAALREDEEAALAAASEPMRNYLVQHIFPTLTPALLEIAKLRPADPVDYLVSMTTFIAYLSEQHKMAEYLFKLNPTGKMLEPGYNLQAEKLLGKIKILDDALQELDIKIDPLIPPEAEIEVPPDPKKEIRAMSAL